MVVGENTVEPRDLGLEVAFGFFLWQLVDDDYDALALGVCASRTSSHPHEATYSQRVVSKRERAGISNPHTAAGHSYERLGFDRDGKPGWVRSVRRE